MSSRSEFNFLNYHNYKYKYNYDEYFVENATTIGKL